MKADKINEAIAALKFDISQLDDPEKVAAFIAAVEGPEAVQNNGPISVERYRKKAARMMTFVMVSHDENAGQKELFNPGESLSSLTEATPIPEDRRGPRAPKKRGVKKLGPSKRKDSKMAKKIKTAPKSRKAAPKGKAPKADKKPGVIDTIVTVLESGGGTAEEITAKVAKKFPDRDADQIGSTVRVQLNRLGKPKTEGGRGLKVKSDRPEGQIAKVYSI